MKILVWEIVAIFALSSSSFHSAWGEQCGRQANGALCPNNLCCSSNGFCGASDVYCGTGCQSQCQGPGPFDVSSLVTRDMFDQMFPRRNDCSTTDFYTYDAFIDAVKSFPAFGTTGFLDTNKREIAAFLAQTAYQTSGGYHNDNNAVLWGYCSKSYENANAGSYCVESERYPCVKDKRYNPRGAMMISYNYNYGSAGDHIELDLLQNPDLVETDPIVSFKTALSYWMLPREPNMPSCHDAMTANWKTSITNDVPGYGLVTKIIHSSCKNVNDKLRVGFYKKACDILSVTYGENLYCTSTKGWKLASVV